MTLVNDYTQNGYVSPAKPFLSDEVYGQVLPVWVKACVDAILYFRTVDGVVRMVIGKRKILPQRDWWIFGGRIFVSDVTLRDALARKLREEIKLPVDVTRIPDEPAVINFMHWSDDNSVILAPAFIIRITEVEYQQMQNNLSVSPEYSELADVDPQDIRDGEQYHEILRKCAAAVINTAAKSVM